MPLLLLPRILEPSSPIHREPEEKEELTELIHSASAATGADDEALAQLPELDF